MTIQKNVVYVFALLLSSIFIVSCASVSVNEYPNITISDQKKIKTIKFHSEESGSHERQRVCVLENVENKEIPIRDSVGIWSAFTIFALLPDKKRVIDEGEVLLSNEGGVIEAIGNLELEKESINGRNFLIYQLTILSTSSGAGTDFLFNDPSIVFEDTGFGKNKGAFPLGSHSLSIFERNYQALEKLVGQIESCLKRK